MARVKLPLEMENGTMARTMEDLKENFDIKKVVGYFLDGKLKTWLEVRYYEGELEKINELSDTDPELAKKLCTIFDVEYINGEIDVNVIQEKNERLLKLKQYTDDEKIIANIDSVAFNQDELENLYGKNVEKIYLCEGEFYIPNTKMNIEYIKIESAEVKYEVVLDHIVPKNCVKDREYSSNKPKPTRPKKESDHINSLIKITANMIKDIYELKEK